MRMLILLTLVFGGLSLARPTFAQETSAMTEEELHAYEQDLFSYEQELREYDRRVAEAEERRWKSLLPVVVILGLLVVYIAYYHRWARRRMNAVMDQTQQIGNQSIQQNQEMIDLLKSINDRLGRGT